MKKKPAKKSPKSKSKKKPTAKAKAVLKKMAAAKKLPPQPEAKPVKKEKETMERTALKVIAAQLKEMGSGIKVLKSDTDEQLQSKVNEHLKEMPKDEILKKLESVVPEKMVSVLKNGCIGVFIDLSDVSCVKCKDVMKCASMFLTNVKGGFKNITQALPDTTVVEKVVEKAKIKAVSRYEADRLVFVRDVKNPNPADDEYHDTLQAILDEAPSTLSELRDIVEREFDFDSDADFMKFVTSMRDPDEGVIKLDVDLSEKNKAELRKAGVEI